VENFNNSASGMSGFTSSTLLSSAPGFTYGTTGQNGYLQRCNISSQGTSYFIVSPTYQSLASQTNIGWGFTLSGDVRASQVDVYVQYIDNTGNINSVLVYTNTATPYTGSGANRQLVLCETTDISTITGFTAGEAFRIVVQLTAEAASNNNQCMIFDDFRVTGTLAQAPLPVTFVGFGAKKTEAGIELIWNVAGEKDVQSYMVERSTTGRDFTKLGEVAATNSTSYSFVDKQTVNGLTFYRIKEVDIDGKFKYSTIVRLSLDRNSSLRAYPSPAKDEVTIEHAVTGKGALSISTTDGRIIKQIDVKPGLYQTVINISALKAGLYVVRFINGSGQTESIKLIKE
jgi:archaellum component FlaG (FlaF/FlaG flagellin family)